MKKRIKQNIWGNWKGYEGRRKVQDFGTDEQAARDWISGIEPETTNQPIKLRGPGYLSNYKPGQ